MQGRNETRTEPTVDPYLCYREVAMRSNSALINLRCLVWPEGAMYKTCNDARSNHCTPRQLQSGWILPADS